MTRPLLIVAVLGFFVSLVCFGFAGVFGGVRWTDAGWWDWEGRAEEITLGGPDVSRTIAWPGGGEISFMTDADVQYVQGPANTIVVTGPQGAVDHVVLRGERLRYDRRLRPRPRLKVVMTAPDVNEFRLYGSQRLKIEGYDQSKLEISMFGSGRAEAAGKARNLELHIAGSGDADLSRLTLADAEISIAGSGDATVGPTESAEVNIAGSGDVTLTTRPARLDTKIAGSGKIIQGAPSEPAAPEPGNAAEPAPAAKT